MTESSPDRLPRFLAIQAFSVIFIGILALHAPLLRLPFFWDEAGYYVPAAHDLAYLHSVTGQTTLDTGHPPLSSAYLALWFLASGWKPAVARIAMLLLAALALTNVFLLARRVAGLGVAVASTIATAIYPIFFVQSSLTHADLMAAAFTLWGIRSGVEGRLWRSQFAFSLAVLSKETAVITPLALAAWELLAVRGMPAQLRLRNFAIRLTPVVPLAGWLLWHHLLTGHFLGSADFYAYNVTYALNPLRILMALGLRLWHLLGFMNMLALTAAMGVAMFLPAVKDGDQTRPRIDIPIQLQFALVMLAHVIAFSVLGGALLKRYLLPAYPLVIIIGMSTLRRRVFRWQWPAGAIVMLFAVALFVDPPYRIAPEDNLRYKDFVELHVQAAHFLEKHEQGATILTAFPATDELQHTYLGYVAKPFPLLSVENFTPEELAKARTMSRQYQVVYLFSTKYLQPTWFHSLWGESVNRRYFDDHSDLPPEVAAAYLGGKPVYQASLHAEWVMILEMEEPGTRAKAKLLPSQ